MAILTVLFLIILNGFLAMAEIAIVSARKSKLQHLINEGDKKTQLALDLANTPNKFLSTVQVGITLIAVFAGAFGEATIAGNLSKYIDTIPLLNPYSDSLSFLIVVILITYLSIVIGELVPKRIALSNPEKIASFVAKPMNILSSITAPIVSLLTYSTDWILKIFRLKPSLDKGISEDEIRLLIQEGARIGIFNIAEKDIVERTFLLSDKKVSTLMTPRKDIVWFNINSSFKVIQNKISKHAYSNYPVCNDSLDKVVGVVRTESILIDFLKKEKINIKYFLQKPLYIPESADGLKLLEMFKKTGIHMALVIDEYANIQGLISLSDIVSAIVGDVPTFGELEETGFKKRNDGTWLIDGLLSTDDFKQLFNIKKLSGDRSGTYQTIGGFVMYRFGHIPVPGDKIKWEDYYFEVIDMDGNRIDKILVIPPKRQLTKSSN